MAEAVTTAAITAIATDTIIIVRSLAIGTDVRAMATTGRREGGRRASTAIIRGRQVAGRAAIMPRRAAGTAVAGVLPRRRAAGMAAGVRRKGRRRRTGRLAETTAVVRTVITGTDAGTTDVAVTADAM